MRRRAHAPSCQACWRGLGQARGDDFRVGTALLASQRRDRRAFSAPLPTLRFCLHAGYEPPRAPSIALRAASAFEPSGPPACAMSGRPPPPLPPSASAPLRTRSTAEKRAVRSAVTPTTRPALPSGEALATATTPDPTLSFPSSASDFSSLFA